MRPSVLKWVWALLAIATLYAASRWVGPLNVQRAEYGLVSPPLPDTLPPSVLLNPLAAVGRAPLVDYLWMRATKLKDEKRYFDAYQLSQMICELQPRFAPVWAFQAWNMSYNISVTLRTPEERWRWVRNGYELLRDKGIPINPDNTQLYRELAWILFHKVGDYMDEWHYYYKLQFALQMEDILGEPPEDYVRPGRVRGDYYRDYDFYALAAAPLKFETLLETPNINKLTEELKSLEAMADEPAPTADEAELGMSGLMLALGKDGDPASVSHLREKITELQRLADRNLLDTSPVVRFAEELREFGFHAEQEGVYLGLLAALKRDDVQIPNAAPGDEVNRVAALKRLMDDPDTRYARTAIECFWRAHRLRNEVKLDPERIIKLQNALGVSFDFRLPDTQALYWSVLGLEKGLDTRQYIDVHKLNTNRIEFYCLQKMFHRGRMAMSRSANLGEPPLYSPDLRMIPILFQAFLRDSKEYLDMESHDNPVSTNFESGFEGFARSAILRYYEAGQEDLAMELFVFMRDKFPDPMYEKGLSGFIAEQFMIDRAMGDIRTVMARLRLLISDGLRMYAYDEDQQAVRRLKRAKRVYDLYQKDVVSNRMQIPRTFEEVIRETVDEIDWRRTPRGSYEYVCAKLGIEPLKQRTGEDGEAKPESQQ
ncbi:MAG: hypothetical protein ABII12_05990 [Planctomycetota bacterium]